MSLAEIPGQSLYDIIDLQGKEIIRLREELARLQVSITRTSHPAIISLTLQSSTQIENARLKPNLRVNKEEDNDGAELLIEHKQRTPESPYAGRVEELRPKDSAMLSITHAVTVENMPSYRDIPILPFCKGNQQHKVLKAARQVSGLP